MGEAKRRAAAQRLAPPVPDDIRTDIANTIRHVTVVTPQAGGMCLVRALTGFMFLRELGLPAGLVFGSMLYRAGPDAVRDVIAYCGPGNCGCLHNGKLLGHVWLRYCDDLIDFSVGDWRRESEALSLSPDPDGRHYGQIQWTAPQLLPEFYWQPWASLAWNTETHPDRHSGTPGIGETWYGPFSGPRPDINEIAEPILPVAKFAYRQIEARARELRLAERVRKFRF